MIEVRKRYPINRAVAAVFGIWDGTQWSVQCFDEMLAVPRDCPFDFGLDSYDDREALRCVLKRIYPLATVGVLAHPELSPQK